MKHSELLQYIQIGLALVIWYLVWSNGAVMHEELKAACTRTP